MILPFCSIIEFNSSAILPPIPVHSTGTCTVKSPRRIDFKTCSNTLGSSVSSPRLRFTDDLGFIGLLDIAANHPVPIQHLPCSEMNDKTELGPSLGDIERF